MEEDDATSRIEAQIAELQQVLLTHLQQQRATPHAEPEVAAVRPIDEVGAPPVPLSEVEIASFELDASARLARAAHELMAQEASLAAQLEARAASLEARAYQLEDRKSVV